MLEALWQGVLAAATVLGRLVMFWKFYWPKAAASDARSGPAVAGRLEDGKARLQAAWRAAQRKVLRPVELRLPGAALGGVGLGALGLMVLMFQIGQQTATVSPNVAGRETTTPTADASRSLPGNADGAVVAMGALPLEPLDVPGGSVTLSNQPRPTVVLPSRDPRAVGLNYFTLLAVPPDMLEEVRELQAYLAANGVVTYLDKTNSGRLRNLVDVTRGYSRQELDTLEYAEHRYRIQALGQRYRKQNGGRGPDLSDIYPDRYDGPATP